MGASGKWLKSIMGRKKAQSDAKEKVEGKSQKKWKLWRSSSAVDRPPFKCFKGGGAVVPSEASDSSRGEDKAAISAAVAALIRAPSKDFMLVRRERAVIRIQAAFRAFLARRALRALKALVRLQAMVRGRQVRKQAAITLQCMQALVRVQAQVRAKTLTISSAGNNAKTLSVQDSNQLKPIKKVEERWCKSSGNTRRVREELHRRQEGVIKRERAIAYSLTQQKLRSNHSSSPLISKSVVSLKYQGKDRNESKWGCSDHRLAASPGSNSLMQDISTDSSEMKLRSKNSDEHSLGQFSGNVRRNIEMNCHRAHEFRRSPSGTNSEFLRNSSSSSASKSSSSTLGSPMMDNSDESITSRPGYMNLTESIKAKQRDGIQKHFMGDFQCHMNPLSFYEENTWSTDFDPASVDLCKDLYPPKQLNRYQW